MRRRLTFESLESRRVFAVAMGEVLPGFSLVDVNAGSATAQQAVSPAQFEGEVTAWYFALATCSYCTTQFLHLNTMQAELEAEFPLLKVNILGVGRYGTEAGVPQITAGRTLPWLQDVDANGNAQSDVTEEQWSAALRDVVIADGAGRKVGVYNLTNRDLGVTANYQTLKQMLVDAAMTSQRPWHNAALPSDVNGDQAVSPLDALLVIIDLNENGARKLAPPSGSTIGHRFDTNGDGFVSPLDALTVIIALNAQTTSPPPQGEALLAADPPATPVTPALDQAIEWMLLGRLLEEDE